MAKVNNNKSFQDYGTPPELLAAIERRFGAVGVDAAATAEDAVCDAYFDDALNADWDEAGDALVYANPRFRLSRLYARKFAESNVRGLLLTPASIDSRWCATHVLPYARIIALSPRVPFMRDGDYAFRDARGRPAGINRAMMLSAYRCPGEKPGELELWRWKQKPSK